MPNVWQALRRGESSRERRRQLERAYERFAEGTGSESDLRRSVETAPALRPVVLDSWLRARQRTIDPGSVLERPALDADALEELRRIHPLARVLPVVQRLLGDEATDSGLIVAVGDAAGRLLWVDGDSRLRAAAEDMGFCAGMDWSESSVGTSAPGSALALDHSIQVLGAEHYNRAVHQWSCTAAPVHDPVSGSIVGVIDVTGGDEAASPHMMPLVEATVAALEAELRLEQLRELVARERAAKARPSRAQGGGQLSGRGAAQGDELDARLVLLGRDTAVLERGGTAVELSRRHAEIMLALATSHRGLSSAALAEEVYGSGEAEATLRPELVRLRKWLAAHAPGIELLSKPYRLSCALRIDARETLEALSRGAHRLALAAYDGPVLPSSEAPVALQLRAEVEATLRESMLQSAGADPLFEYAQQWARDDTEVWHTLLRLLPPLSPKRARVVARLEAQQEQEQE